MHSYFYILRLKIPFVVIMIATELTVSGYNKLRLKFYRVSVNSLFAERFINFSSVIFQSQFNTFTTLFHSLPKQF